jgi:hypothetical protein
MTDVLRTSWSAEFWHPQPLSGTFIELWQVAVRWSCLMFIVMQLLGGVARWVLDMAGAAVLTYVPNVAMLMCVGIMLTVDSLTQRTSRGVVLFFLILLISMVVGWHNTHSLPQVVFGAWVLTPFFFGLTTAPLLLKVDRLVFWVMVGMFVTAAGGTVVHSFVDYPWVGVSYSVGGVELEGAREWYVEGGNRRLSGLARSSFDVAGQVLVAAALMALQMKRGWARFVIWGLAGAAISLSTSKGILLAMLMTACSVEAVRMQSVRGMVFILSVGFVWLFLPPVMGWTMDWSEAARTDLENPLYGSFIDRMNDMWPRAWELGTDHGLPPLGRGLGGIGVPVSIFEPELANAGDNLFVYCLVLLGVFAVPLFAAAAVALYRLCLKLDLESVRLSMVLAVAVMWYGGVSNILEHAFLAFACGLVTRVIVAELAGLPLGKTWTE